MIGEKKDYSFALEQPDEFELQLAWWRTEANLSLVYQIAERIPKGATVLDAGAGAGVAIPYWSERAADVMALDRCRRACEHMRRNYPDAMIILGDIRHMGTVSAEVVIAKHVLKHFGAEWRDVLRCIVRAATERVIFTMNVADQEGDRNPDAPYYDWAAPEAEIFAALPEGWCCVEKFGDDPAEPVFVCDRMKGAA